MCSVRKKMWLILLCTFWMVPKVMSMQPNNFTFTYDMALRCKEHLCQHGYKYETFYQVGSENRRQIKKEPNVIFEMHIAILAGSNGLILLSSDRRPGITDPVYEIVIGGGGNRFTELRRNLRRNAKASATTFGILSAIEFRAFYIKINEDGLIEFGREGDILPIISYQDIDPITIRYFSFASWEGVEAKFLYDCPRPDDKDIDDTPNSQAIEPPLSNTDALKRTMLINRDPNITPDPNMNIQLAIQITSVNYDAFDSRLTTGVSIITSWLDNSMAWNPDKFNNTTMVNFRPGQIWSPKFFVYNSDNAGMLNPRNPEPILMLSNGLATHHFQTQIQTSCYDHVNAMSRWPRDEYICGIIIEPWEAYEKISISEFPSFDLTVKSFTDNIDEVIQNAWDLETDTHILNSTVWVTTYGTNDDQTHQSDRYIMSLTLRRRASAYNVVFYTPLIVLLIFVLMSFWTEPLILARVWFYASTTIVICMGLCYIDYLIPCHAIPSILYLYTVVLGGVLLALIIHVALMTAVAEKLCKTMVVQNILMAECFRTVFSLPVVKTCQIYETINEGYSTQQEDDDSGVVLPPRFSNVEEMQTDKQEYSERKEVAEVLDKVMFFTYSVGFAVMLALHY